MIEVEVPGKGIAEFPDGMNPRDIEHSIFQTWPELADTPAKQKKAELLTARSQALGHAYGAPTGELQEAIGEGLVEGLTTPFAKLPRPPKLQPDPGTQLPVVGNAIHAVTGAIDTAFEKLIGAVESVETPLSGLLVATGAAAPKAAAGLIGLMGGGTVVQGVKETAKGISDGSLPGVVGGAIDTALGATMIAGAGAMTKAAPAEPAAVTATKSAVDATIKPVAPTSAEAVKGTVDLLTGKSVPEQTRTKPLPEPTAPPVEQAAVGIVPESVQKLAELQHGQSLIDQNRIKTAAPEKDVMPARDYIASPEFQFRNIPEADRLVTMGVEANLAFKSKVAHTAQQLDAFQKTLTPGEQKTLTDALFAKEAGAKDALEKLPPAAKEAAGAIRQTYDTIRERVIADKQKSITDELSGPQMNALRQIQDGMALEEAAKANGLKGSGKLIVESAKQELDDLAKWGIEDFTTHIERGSYRVITPEGTTVAIGETRAAAAIKADRWLKENPDVKTVTIDDSFNPGVEFPTQLSKGQYFRLVQRLKDNLGETASEMQNILRQNGSIVTVKPTNKYAGPMQKRHNILKGEENIFDILPTYVHIMEKKLALDPVMREARNVLPNLPENARAQVETWLKDLKGQKSVGDRIADYLLDPMGLKSFAYSRSLEKVRSVSTSLKLGYRPVAAIVNRISGLQHTWTKVGTKYLLEGKAFLKTKEGQRLLEENKPLLGIEAAFIHENLRPTSQEPLWKPLGMFQAAERSNRPEAFAAHYKFAEGELGLKGAEAATYARKATRFGQFVYDAASLPRLLRGPTGRFLFQFKPYLVKELEFISTLRGAEIPRYLAGFLAVGGPRAALATLKSLPVIGVFAGFDKAEDFLNQNAPSVSRGAGAVAGIDISPSVAFQFPQSAAELLGPVVSDMAKLFKDVVAPWLQGEQRDWSDVQDWGQKLAPALNYWSQLVEAASSESGWITDSRGRMLYKPSKSDYVKLALGAKPLEKSVQEVENRFLRDQEEVIRKNRARLISQFLEASKEKDGAKVQELAQELANAGVTVESVRAAAKSQQIEPQLRLLRSLSKHTRSKEIERFVPKPE